MDLWNIEVIASTPNKLVLQINSVSIICGASTPDKVHHKHTNKLIIHPANPHILLLDIDFSPENNWIKNSLSFIIYYFAQKYKFNFEYQN